MNVPDWQRRAQSVIDVGRLPSFSLQGSGRRAGRITLILLVLVGLYSTYYQVNADEVGVVQRFGRYVRTTGPGAHVKIPFVERVTRVPVQRQLKTEFGFRTTASGIQSQFEQTDVTKAESLMLTGDLAQTLSLLWIILILAVLEVSLSFDNAVVNASVLEDMNEVWQQRFLTWGMAIAVFGMRVIFPLAIVAVAAGLGPVEALKLSLNDPDRYEAIVSGAGKGDLPQSLSDHAPINYVTAAEYSNT